MSLKDKENRYVVIHCEATTIAVGVYPTEKKAMVAYLKFLKSRYPQMLSSALSCIEEETGVSFEGLTEIQIVALMDTNSDIQDSFGDEISHIIHHQGDDNLFDFTGFKDWNMVSLYMLLAYLNGNILGDSWKKSSLVDIRCEDA